MKLVTLIFVLLVAAICAFVALNWDVLSVPASFSLLITTVQARPGMVILGMMSALAAVFLISLAYIQTSALIEARRSSLELTRQRQLADDAEASRFTNLGTQLERDFVILGEKIAASETALRTRIDQADRDLRTATEQTSNAIAAQIGELDDRLARGQRPPLGG